MPRLSLDKQEKFANYLANGYTQVAAYREAGYTAKNSAAAANASKLANDPHVKIRIEELKNRHEEKAATSVAPPLPMKPRHDGQDIDISWFNREYIQLLNMAKEGEMIKEAMAILKDMAELNKIRPEKTEEDNKNNRTLPNYASSNMAPQVNISLIDSKSKEDGGMSLGPYAIEISDPATHSNEDT